LRRKAQAAVSEPLCARQAFNRKLAEIFKLKPRLPAEKCTLYRARPDVLAMSRIAPLHKEAREQ